MSGEALRVMIVFGFSTVTVVRSGGGPSSSSRWSSHSPSASRLGRLKRVGVRFSGAPRPARASGRIWISVGAELEQIKNDSDRRLESAVEALGGLISSLSHLGRGT